MCAAGERTAEDCQADPDARDRRGGTPLHSLYEGVESAMGIIRADGGGVARYDVLQVLLEDLGNHPRTGQSVRCPAAGP